jgi:serine/threonine-protein kinase
VALEQIKTQVLLLHSEQRTLDNLSSGFNDRYTVHCATSGSEALTTLGETPIHIIVSAQDLPGMSGLDALREAKKRSPDTIGILLAGDKSEGLEALVGDQEVFQIVRGEITPEALRGLIDNATRQVRLLALADSANDTTADVDQPGAEHIVMETSENGSAIISDGTGRMPILDPKKFSSDVGIGTRSVDVLVLTKDEEFLATIRDSSRGLHKIHYANTVSQADEMVRANKIGVAVVDAAMAGSNVEKLTLHLRKAIPRLVAIVAGRRDDGEMLMDLINRGKVYRFLLKPVSPGRARLAVEASVKHHLEAPDTAFVNADKGSPAKVTVPGALPKAAPAPRPNLQPAAKVVENKTAKPFARSMPIIEVPPDTDRLSDFFEGDDHSFTETVTGMVKSVTESFTGIRESFDNSADDEFESGSQTVATPTIAPVNSHSSDGSGGSLLGSPKILGVGAAALILIATTGYWIFGGSNDPVAIQEPVVGTPRFSEADPIVDTDPPAEVQQSSDELLREARLARGAGQIYDPPGSNAIELYMAASAAAPDDIVIADEMRTVIQQALANAESALLERRIDNAEAALSRIALADPENVRLPFLSAQLSQMQLRSFLDDARLSLRETRFEDAAIALTGARTLGLSDTVEIETIESELSDARSEQRADDVLAQAAVRLDEGKLTAPSNDNARYFYELVLSNDADNAAALQGLTVIASQLVLQARTQIDRGNFNTAAALLADARKLDPSSSTVSETSTALTAAREREAQQQRDAAAAEQRAEQERLAAEELATAAAVAAAVQEQDGNVVDEATSDASNGAGIVAAAAVVAGGANSESADAGAASSNSRAAADTAADLLHSDPISEQAVAEQPVSEGPITDEDSGALPAQSQAAVAVTIEPETLLQEGAEKSALNEIPIAISTLTRSKYIAPKYPRSAIRRNLSGWVDVVFIVTINGDVRDVSVTGSDPGDTFVNSATKAVENWEFEPVIENGTPVERRAAVRMLFALE